MLLAPALLLACGSSPKPGPGVGLAASGAGTGTTNSAPADPPSDKPETDGQRRVRLGLLRREQCRAIGSVIQDAQREDAIININDTGSLQRIGRDLDQSATKIEAVEVTDKGLATLRGEYVANSREMSKQLGAMATAKSEGARRAASGKFSACQDKIGVYIQKLNEYCNAPVK